MDRDLTQDEQLSALMDGELDDASLAEALSFAADKGQATWELYHLVGDVLRSPELAAHATSPLLGRLREQIAQEPRFPVQKPEEAVVVARSAVGGSDAVQRRDARNRCHPDDARDQASPCRIRIVVAVRPQAKRVG